MPRKPPSDKSRGIATALAATLGVFGVHRFYVGKIGTGMLMLLTGGGLGIWYVYDVIIVASGAFRDADGYALTEWGPEGVGRDHLLSQEVIDEMDALRADMAEMQERLDFTERLLTRNTEAAKGDTEDSFPAITPR
jgi:TM2 domain-containing membrane protein YozV